MNDSSLISKKGIRRPGGFSDALSIAADLGFSVSPPPHKEDKNVAHLTHASEMGKKIETLGRITTILKDVIQNKDRIITRLQQPYMLDYIPVEAEFQKQFYELLEKAAIDYGSLTASVADFQWTQNFKEPPSMWGEMLRPIPVALASCTRYFEAISATRESFAILQKQRVGHASASLLTSPASSSKKEAGDSDFVPFPWKNESIFEDLSPGKLQRQEIGHYEADDNSDTSSFYQLDIRRLSLPSSVKSSGW